MIIYYNYKKIKKRKKSLKSMEARRKKGELRVNAFELTQWLYRCFWKNRFYFLAVYPQLVQGIPSRFVHNFKDVFWLEKLPP
jgi:hypothetical protein